MKVVEKSKKACWLLAAPLSSWPWDHVFTLLEKRRQKLMAVCHRSGANLYVSYKKKLKRKIH